ncbi:lytic transglycosylase domain-containing protein [Pseudomonas sp. H3(2019)]|uniref:lytic transglycosylase domain-containing protein n=1 Tax=Pseudomonas sp. H3(2019) TaxID=2598724 RepID=UPI001192A7CC|nr:lytic transglycosylase domain-containing protein [Pseudomonas sp. H3(2019)]TVT81955.1 lytic transglycosylase domain-containing protein [Pseudomonas sp. H3(2019)]
MATPIVRTAFASALICATAMAHAAEIPPPAYQLIAIPEGVPSEVLYSVALQESGTKLRGHIVPWPWTLNVAGAGYRFATRSDACQALMIAIVSVGPARVDVGLGQTNMKANGYRYGSPCEGLDPYKNLKVTAQILAEHKAKGGDWITAAGRYHRPAGGAPAERYRRAFTKHLSRVTGIKLMVDNQ